MNRPQKVLTKFIYSLVFVLSFTTYKHTHTPGAGVVNAQISRPPPSAATAAIMVAAVVVVVVVVGSSRNHKP